MKIEELKSLEDACKVLCLDAEKVMPDFSMFPERDRAAMTAHAALVIITRAANKIDNNGKEWEPDWDNGKWDKYYNWFWMNGGSSGFRFRVCDDWYSDSNVGSRLCFKSKEVAEYVANQFSALYKDYFVM